MGWTGDGFKIQIEYYDLRQRQKRSNVLVFSSASK